MTAWRVGEASRQGVGQDGRLSVQEIETALKLGTQMVPWSGDCALAGVLRQRSEQLDGVLRESS